MLSIFIPQETLEDIIIDNMASDMEPEKQDTWFKIFTKQDIIYVSLLDEKDYITEKDLLFRLTKSYKLWSQDKECNELHKCHSRTTWVGHSVLEWYLPA